MGSYLLKDVDFNLLNFKYRGKIVEAGSSDYFNTLLNNLKEQGRIFEFLNLYLLLNGASEEYLELLCNALLSCFKEDNCKVSEYNIKGIFELVEFYSDIPRLPFTFFCGIYKINRTF